MARSGDGRDAVERNRAQQIAWYGEPLGSRFRRLLDRLGLSQGELAPVLGLSAPMLSQLMTGQRARIGNPAVLARLHEAEVLAAGFADLAQDERVAALDAIRRHIPGTSTEIRLTTTPWTAPAADPASAVQALLRAVADVAEIEEAAGALQAHHPALAEVLRTYGTGHADGARAHYAATVLAP